MMPPTRMLPNIFSSAFDSKPDLPELLFSFMQLMFKLDDDLLTETTPGELIFLIPSSFLRVHSAFTGVFEPAQTAKTVIGCVESAFIAAQAER